MIWQPSSRMDTALGTRPILWESHAVSTMPCNTSDIQRGPGSFGLMLFASTKPVRRNRAPKSNACTRSAAWLGPEPNERAFYFILEVSRYFVTRNDNKILPQNPQFEHFWLCKLIDECYPRFRGCMQSLFAQWHHENRAAFPRLVRETRWFQRAWVFQEGAASKHKILQQGSFAISWNSFSYERVRTGNDPHLSGLFGLSSSTKRQKIGTANSLSPHDQ